MFGRATAAISSTPMISRITWPLTLRWPRPMRRQTMMNAEMTPPIMLPLPPVEDMPPNTAMAMASISKPVPVVVFAP